MIDVRFPTTLQMMLSLALAADEGALLLNSTQLAEGAGTSPTLVRRLLPFLAKSGLIHVVRGREGGVRLAKPASEITLRAIYEVAIGEDPLWNARQNIPHRCVVSNNIGDFFEELTREAQNAVLTSLERRTLAESLKQLREQEAKSALRIE